MILKLNLFKNKNRGQIMCLLACTAHTIHNFGGMQPIIFIHILDIFCIQSFIYTCVLVSQQGWSSYLTLKLLDQGPKPLLRAEGNLSVLLRSPKSLLHLTAIGTSFLLYVCKCMRVHVCARACVCVGLGKVEEKFIDRQKIWWEIVRQSLYIDR